MKRLFGKITTLLVFVLPGFLLSGCLPFLVFNYGNFFFSPISTAVIEDLSEVETDLMDSGPVDLPVTIAKLDSPDTDLISVEVEEITATPSLNGFELEKNLQQTTGTTYKVTLTGQAKAIRDAKLTPFVISWVMKDNQLDLGSELRTIVASDGAFSLAHTLTDLDTQEVIFSAMAHDLVRGSSPVAMAPSHGTFRKKNDFFAATLTNSNFIDTSTNVTADNTGAYFVALDKEGSFSLVRRALNGGPPQKIVENASEAIDLVKSYDPEYVVYITSGGKVVLSAPSQPASSVSALVTNTPHDPLYSEVSAVEEVLTTLEDYDTSTTQLHVGPENIAITQGGDVQRLLVIGLTSGQPVELIKDGLFEDINIARMRGESETYFIFTKDDDGWDLSEVDLSGSVGLAWKQRTEHLSDLIFDDVSNLTASNEGTIAFAAQTGSNSEIYYWNETEGLVEFYDESEDAVVYRNPKIHPDGGLIVVCELDDTGNQLVSYNIDAAAFDAITGKKGFDHCQSEGQSTFVGQNFVHFNREKIDGSVKPQRVVVGLKPAL